MSDKQTAYENIGGLWLKTSKTGTEYLTGRLVIGGIEAIVTIWPNANKKSTADVRTPDFVAKAIVTEREAEEEHLF